MSTEKAKNQVKNDIIMSAFCPDTGARLPELEIQVTKDGKVTQEYLNVIFTMAFSKIVYGDHDEPQWGLVVEKIAQDGVSLGDMLEPENYGRSFLKYVTQTVKKMDKRVAKVLSNDVSGTVDAVCIEIAAGLYDHIVEILKKGPQE